MIRFEEKKDAAKQAEPARVDSGRMELARQVQHGKDNFDRTAYQREYMRRWRAKRQAGRPSKYGPVKPWQSEGISRQMWYRRQKKSAKPSEG